jgi:hypothetical protein
VQQRVIEPAQWGVLEGERETCSNEQYDRGKGFVFDEPQRAFEPAVLFLFHQWSLLAVFRSMLLGALLPEFNSNTDQGPT